MRVLEVILTFIFLLGIIYTAVPLALSMYLFLIPSHTHNGDVFAVDKAVVNEVTEEIKDQPIPAYAITSHQPKAIAQLQTALQVCRPPQPHSGSFDCSNFAAYTEYYLENRGFNTTISASLTEGHAWISVHRIANYTEVHVECIPPVHISGTLPPVEVSYNNITEALAGDYPDEWKWWST